MGPDNPFYDERAAAKMEESAKRTCGAYCQLCGAWRGQLGLEPNPSMFIEHLTIISREIRRILKPSGSYWLNLGDTYYGSGGNSSQWPDTLSGKETRPAPEKAVTNSKVRTNWLQPKQKLMIPARVAIALQDDGWILRNEVVWSKPNNMPESVLDRLTETWESFFFFVKARKYYFDLDAVRVPHSSATVKRYNFAIRKDETYGVNTKQKRENPEWTVQGLQERPGRKSMAQAMDLDKGKNPGDIWVIPTNSYHGAHFATFPEKLVEPIIRAACPPEGLVMDPFAGSGTTLLVARRLCRHFLGVELNPEYVKMASDRLAAVPVRIEQFFNEKV